MVKALTPPKRPQLNAPVRLKPEHNLERFDCGDAGLNKWLRVTALDAQKAGTAAVRVACRGTKHVVGFYTLSAFTVARSAAPGRLKRDAPDPIPGILLGRLAVSQEEQGRGMGLCLMDDAMRRTVQAAAIIGARALIVHVANPDAHGFYKKLGFKDFPEPTGGLVTMYLPLTEIAAGLDAATR